jgi:hypothetical protein
MSRSYGPLDIQCDAPPYHIVKASSEVGIEAPEDVRWFRLSHYLDGSAGATPRQPWMSFWLLTQPNARRCTCGENLPTLRKFVFTFRSGKESGYHLGQCQRCRTAYWEEA